jgi:hypothetical protein
MNSQAGEYHKKGISRTSGYVYITDYIVPDDYYEIEILPGLQVTLRYSHIQRTIPAYFFLFHIIHFPLSYLHAAVQLIVGES